MLAEITGLHYSNAGQHALYWSKQEGDDPGTAMEYKTGTSYRLPRGWKVFFTNYFMDADGKCPLKNEAGEFAAVDYKTGEAQPFTYRESFSPMGISGDKILIWEWTETVERWGLWEIEDYR